MPAKDDLIQAAGGLLWRDAPDGRQIAIVHRPKYDDWTLPKGKLKSGEDWIGAARREVEEETGCQVDVKDYAGQVDYQIKGTPKTVRFWEMVLAGECHFQSNKEIDALDWVAVEDALQRLSYAGERELLKQWQESCHRER